MIVMLLMWVKLKELCKFELVSMKSHSFDFGNARILNKGSHYYCRLTSEMVHINTQNNGINTPIFCKLNATYRLFLIELKN